MTLALFKQGKEAWNAWANELLEKKVEMACMVQLGAVRRAHPGPKPSEAHPLDDLWRRSALPKSAPADHAAAS